MAVPEGSLPDTRAELSAACLVTGEHGTGPGTGHSMPCCWKRFPAGSVCCSAGPPCCCGPGELGHGRVVWVKNLARCQACWDVVGKAFLGLVLRLTVPLFRGGSAVAVDGIRRVCGAAAGLVLPCSRCLSSWVCWHCYQNRLELNEWISPFCSAVCVLRHSFPHECSC